MIDTRNNRTLYRSAATGLKRFAVLAVATGALTLASCSGTGTPENTDWTVLGNGPDVQHHSDLAQIDKNNVATLGLAWAGEIPSADGLVGNPLVKDGVVFQSGSLGRIYATDIRTGKLLWQFEPALDFARMSFGQKWSIRLNRGLALTADLAIVGAGDCRVFAVNQKTGKLVWETQSCDAGSLYGITGAPRVGGGKVFIGNNCTESGTLRGFVDALDERTGKRLWRFYTVPDDPSKPQANPALEKAATTWGEGWYDKTRGCGSPWEAMTYDPKLDLLYVGTGGPAPWTPTGRGRGAGDELFTNAIVAINARTGQYVWHYTVTPNDGWNFEATMPIMVAELPIDGKTRRVVMSAPKNGFFYVLDAKTGAFISAKNPVPVNWASGIDPQTGRPIQTSEGRYWEKPGGVGIVWPGPLGAHNWSAMAFDPAQRLVYVPFDHIPTRMKVDPSVTGPGVTNELFGFEKDVPGYDRYSELVAWDPLTQSARWRVRSKSLINGGVLHIAGGVVFQGTSDGRFNAYDDASGKQLWSFATGGAVQSAPTTVMVDGVQYILIASGNGNSMLSGRYASRDATTAATRSAPSRLLAFRIGGAARLTPVAPQVVPKPPLPRPPAALAAAGVTKFDAYACLECHGRDALSPGGSVPDLRFSNAYIHEAFDKIVRGGLLEETGMPAFPEMPDSDLKALQAFILSRAWAGYDASRPANDANQTPPAKKRNHP